MTEFKRIGFAGAGNMGRALVEGVLEVGLYKPKNIHVFDPDTEKMKAVTSRGVKAADSLAELVKKTDILFLCVKPGKVARVLEEAGPVAHLVSIAAGVKLEDLRKNTSPETELIRVMPNTPAQIGEGMSFIAPDRDTGRDFLEKTRAVFEAVGEVKIIDEKSMDAATALAGSGPAYVFYFLEALEEAGIYMGLDGDTARQAATQTFLGAAHLAAESDFSASELRRQVSSPGGTTVEAIKCLDDAGVKGKIIEAIRCARDKSLRMSDS